ncbi:MULTISPECIES: helix-hairpin-helix domain-containing protein [unclassified Caballeronia]|uniref:ComEA family DNA-binding protein n=1 Tax=unclassified Caballeronia TaxID=2646786 RepID=UPI00285780BF|nr:MULTISPECIES: helix-hairpin-helix domain-containing protein [unclassified Caballeronia]MDR5737789.1 helix-hairpin-helix domain-containing protein [Caballeronia sp. LZ016]MDR5809675.1 helix-hairpin-helix domain-containing protein [Caballeronia sp. LZ019]
MFKQALSTIVAFALTLSIGSAFAAVDVNTANTDALRGIKGIGPAKAKAILDERQAHGPFKDAADLSARVKGMGGKTVQRLEAEGLSIGNAPKTAAASAGGANHVSATPVASSAGSKPVVVKK